MAVSGLVLLGDLLAVDQVTYGSNHKQAGEPVPGFYRATIGIGEAWDGQPMTRQLTFNATDRDTGEPTKIFDQFQRVPYGARVAVGVTARLPKPGGKYVEFDPRYVTQLAGEPVPALSGDDAA